MANVRTIPGILTMRGCSYAGCRGVVLGPTRDILQITHGPIGCGFYAWLTRRNQTKPATDKDENFMTYSMSTDMTENEIIFGGEKKLKAAIEEAISIFHPKAIGIFATCPVGLIGDDIHAVAREMESLHPEVNIFGFSCEGYRGVSQSAGHHVANNKVFTDVVGLNDTVKEGKYKINLLGEYNIGGDAFELDRIFEKCGITVVSTFSGNSTYDDFTRAHTADLNLVMCHRSINYLAEMMEKKYGLPWFKVNFIGAYDTAKSLRKIGEYFGDKELKDKIEKVIAEEMIVVEEIKKDDLESFIQKFSPEDTSNEIVTVAGIPNIMIKFAKCCSPIPGENIIGFITRGRGVTIHTTDCTKIADTDEERHVEATWNVKESKDTTVKIRVLVTDNPGILHELTSVIAEHNVNISSLNIETIKDKKAICVFGLNTFSINHLNKVIDGLGAVQGVISVKRVKS